MSKKEFLFLSFFLSLSLSLSQIMDGMLMNYSKSHVNQIFPAHKKKNFEHTYRRRARGLHFHLVRLSLLFRVWFLVP